MTQPDRPVPHAPEAGASYHDLQRKVAALAVAQRRARRQMRALWAVALGLGLSASVLGAGAQEGQEAPSRLIAFQSGQTASAADVNANFQTLKDWIEAKVGLVDEPASVDTTGALSAGSLTATGTVQGQRLVVDAPGDPTAVGERRGLFIGGINDPMFVGVEARTAEDDNWDAMIRWSDNTNDRLRFRAAPHDADHLDVMTLEADGDVTVAGALSAASINGKSLTLDCATKTTTIPNGNDISRSLTCNTGYKLTGCGVHSAWDDDGEEVNGDSCTGHNGTSDHSATMWIRCCRIQ